MVEGTGRPRERKAGGTAAAAAGTGPAVFVWPQNYDEVYPLPRVLPARAHPAPPAHYSLFTAFHTRMAEGLEVAGRTATAEEVRAACIFVVEGKGGKGR